MVVMWRKTHHCLNRFSFPHCGFFSGLFHKTELASIVFRVGSRTGDQSVKVDPWFFLKSWQEKGFAEQAGTDHSGGDCPFLKR